MNFPVSTQGVGEDIFQDLHDDILVWTDPEGRGREFVAFGDYGFVRFAEVGEENAIPFAFPPTVGTPPIPAPTAGINPAVVGAVAGSLAMAMAARMALAKKKRTAEAPSL